MRRRKPGAGLVAMALCLGGALTACGGTDDEGYAAVGAGPSPKGAVAPSGVVTLVPLERPSASGTTSSTSSPSPGAPGTSTTGPGGASPDPSGGPEAPGTPGPPGSSRTDTGAGTGAGTGTSAGPGSGPGPGSTAAPTAAPGHGGSGTGAPPRTPSATPRPSAPGTGTPSPAPTTPPGPAVLTVSAPGLAAGDRRWCQRVTVTFRNTGGSPATSGTVGFSTHIIGLLGTDWATVDSRQPLPAPIAPGTARTETYTVCVDSWRVPLGMRIDTREVTAAWR
ncbi:hypothetical protein ACFCWY_02070 [Streptomyces sp. NPDC056362]|uniref:hypothetical protein n=1 Tax=unclassified Streptomyces TaxID=2593676 RepID=UPI0035E1ECFF